MSQTTSPDPADLPVFPATAPPVFADPDATARLVEPVLAALAEVVDPRSEQLSDPTPCSGFDVERLRAHTVGWLEFFATALNDPDGVAGRPDPDAWQLPDDTTGADRVRTATAAILEAIAAGAATKLIVMSQARMHGDAVLAMALGEYLVHGWDLATATGRSWPAFDEPSGPALEFLRSTVAPEHRGPDSGFFDAEVPAPDGATPLEALLCFAGRDPEWPS